MRRKIIKFNLMTLSLRTKLTFLIKLEILQLFQIDLFYFWKISPPLWECYTPHWHELDGLAACRPVYKNVCLRHLSVCLSCRVCLDHVYLSKSWSKSVAIYQQLQALHTVLTKRVRNLIIIFSSLVHFFLFFITNKSFCRIFSM